MQKTEEPAPAAVSRSKGMKSGGDAPAEKATGKTKKEKDPNAPKRATTAYFFWLNANRPNIAKPGMSGPDVIISYVFSCKKHRLVESSSYGPS